MNEMQNHLDLKTFFDPDAKKLLVNISFPKN